jgi:hypothetical protein
MQLDRAACLDWIAAYRPEQTVFFIRGVCQGQSSAQLARELKASRTTATEVQPQLQGKAEQAQPETPLDDLAVETDEMFQNAGKKSEWQPDPDDPPCCRANKQRGSRVQIRLNMTPV